MSEPTNTNIDYLATLPLELIENMMIHMDIDTVFSIRSQVSRAQDKTGRYDKVITACNTRLSATKYIDTIFGSGSGIKILMAMAKSQGYMSGSMAAEFHCPGAATSESDCDFFVARDVRQIYRFMNDLASIGVIWWNTTEVFVKSLRKHNDEVNTSAALFRELKRNGTVTAKMDELDLGSIDQYEDESNAYCTVTVGEKDLIVKYHDKPNTYSSSGSELHIIQGEFNKGGERTLIQLIVERRLPSAMCNVPAMMKFHSSVTQSFIGPCSSGHMYSGITAQMKTYGWSSIAKRTDKLPIPSTAFTVDTTSVRQWKKFESRGYEYISTDGDKDHCRLRHIRDCDASYIEYPDNIDIPYFVKELYMEYSKNLAWFETSTGVVKVNAPIYTIRRQQHFDVQHWLHTDSAPRTVCVEYLTNYMPYSALLQDAAVRLRHITLHVSDDEDGTDEE